MRHHATSLAPSGVHPPSLCVHLVCVSDNSHSFMRRACLAAHLIHVPCAKVPLRSYATHHGFSEPALEDLHAVNGLLHSSTSHQPVSQHISVLPDAVRTVDGLRIDGCASSERERARQWMDSIQLLQTVIKDRQKVTSEKRTGIPRRVQDDDSIRTRQCQPDSSHSGRQKAHCGHCTNSFCLATSTQTLCCSVRMMKL